MSKKQIFIILVLFFGAVLVGIFFLDKFQPTQQTENTQPTPLTTPPAPTFPAPATKNKQYYTFAVSFSFTPPESLPIYKIDSQNETEETPKLLANSFGFSGTPVISKGAKGTYFIWENIDGSTFLINTTVPYTIYNTTPFLPNTQITTTEAELRTTAQQFFLKLSGGISPEIKILPSRYFAPKDGNINPVQSLSDATLVQLNWQYTKDNYPLFSFNPTAPSISADVNSNKQIVKLTATIYPPTTKLNETHKLISLQTALRKLNIGEGVLVQATATQTKDSDIEPQRKISLSELTSAEVGYYFSKTAPTLLPVYVFTGTGTDTKNNEKVVTTTIVSAQE